MPAINSIITGTYSNDFSVIDEFLKLELKKRTQFEREKDKYKRKRKENEMRQPPWPVRELARISPHCMCWAILPLIAETTLCSILCFMLVSLSILAMAPMLPFFLNYLNLSSEEIFLAGEKIGLPLIRPFYSQNGSLNEVLKGLNFGSTQATIMSRRGRQSHQSLTQQLRQVSETLQLLQLHLREDTALQFTKSSIFILSFGKEDYTDLLLGNISSKVFNYNVHDFATILVNQMTNALRYLYDINARKIICLGIVPLGFTPRVAWICNRASSAGDDHGKSCVDQANKLVLEYNKLLAKHIEELNKEFTDAHIVFCDVYEGLMEIMKKGNLYGFDDTKSACCGLGLYNATVGCISMDTACDQASSHVWWDLLNPTYAVNSILANAAWSGHPFSGLCHPLTIHELVTKA
ncbi:GDSL esterase/lipase At1g71250-like [Prosopis cineraria]|uniref:GDSL esterase/lipase At1g71250-like n=1 Tax=Prosopis cineraria TaxID=364024 RepID=UPI00240FBA74|nr:GDSL esterase/lipase At1g71250-like [Prosopis cineraria]